MSLASDALKPSSDGEPLKKPKRTPRRLASLAGVTLFGVVCAGLWLASRDPGVPRQKLADGTWLELRDQEYGINPELDERRGWQRWLPRNVVVLPFKSLQLPVVYSNKNWVNIKAPGRYTNALTLNCVVGHTKGAPMTSYAAVYGVITDEHGCWFEPRFADYGHSQDTMMLYWLQFNHPPRDSQELKLGFYDSYGRKPLASFPVKRPLESGAEAKIGKPQDLPITISNGELTFTLAALNHRHVGLHRREAAEFRVSNRAGSTGDWRPDSIKVTDASGATAESSSLLSNGEIRFAGLCRRSPAWRLDVEFVRVEDRLKVERRKVTFVVKP